MGGVYLILVRSDIFWQSYKIVDKKINFTKIHILIHIHSMDSKRDIFKHKGKNEIS